MLYIFIYQMKLLILFGFIAISAGSKLEMPSFTKSGTTIEIECELDYEKNDIEHVRWYKDNQPFYTVTPANTDPVIKVNLPGVLFDEKESEMHRITLASVKEETSGLYTCEIKTDNGLARMSGTLTVYTAKE